MKRRFLAMLMLAVLTISMFTACGDKKDPQATEPGGRIFTVTLAHDLEGAPLEVLRTYLDLLCETFPNIKVELVSAAEAENPDVLYCMPDRAAELAADNKLLDMMSMIEDDDTMLAAGDDSLVSVGLSTDQLNDFFDFYYKDGFVGKELYSMPIAKTTQILYYNQTFFDENLLDLPATWEELEAIIVQMKEMDPDSIPLCIEDPADFFITMCAQNNGDYTSQKGDIQFNNKTNRAFMEKLNSWYRKGYVTTRTIMGRDSAGALLSTDTRHYMAIGSTSHAYNQQTHDSTESFGFELGAFPFPQQSYENLKVLARGPGLSIFKTSDEGLLYRAWMVVKFLSTNTEFQSKFAQASGMLPVLISAELEESYSDYLDSANGGDQVNALAALISMEQQHAIFTAPIFDGSANAYDQVGLLLDKCLTITGDDVSDQIEDAFKDAVKACK